MYIRNFGYRTNPRVKYTGLKVESIYWCPYLVKYVAWFIIAAIIITSCTVLLFYGTSFGKIKIYLWMATFLTSVIVSLNVFTPIRIFIFALLDTFCFKSLPVITNRKIHTSLLENADDPDKKEKVFKYRQFNANLYAPMPLSKLQNRLEDIKYNIELQNVVLDAIVHVFFMAIIICMVQINKSEMAYYSTETVKKLIIRGNYTNSIPFSKVTTYEMFLEYLNETFLPALLLNYTDYGKNNQSRERRWVQEYKGYKNLPVGVQKRQILSDFVGEDDDMEGKGSASALQKGRTMNPNLQLLGKPRLRQVRVKTGSCKQQVHLKGRNEECAADLTPFNVERGTFTLQWGPGPPKGLTLSQATPWMYQSASATETLPIYGKYTIYPGGGYILTLARDIRDARIILDFLDAFQWVDMRTRAVFIEFTLYCVNTNLFSVVTLIAEKTASGYIIPNYQISTCKFIFLVPELEFIFGFMLFLFVCLLLFLIVREGVRIHRTTIVPYLKSGFAWVDLAIVLLGVASLICIFWRRYYVAQLLKNLEQSDNNEFVSFIYAAAWHNWSTYMEAFLICFCFFKVFRLLTFRVVFFQLQTTLTHCYKQFISLFIQQLLLILAFSFFFYLTLATYNYAFSSFDVTLTTMIWGAVSLDDSFDFSVFVSSPWYLGSLFLALFVFLVVILFVNTFIAVVCLYFRETQKAPLVNKYNVLEYIRHSIMGKNRNDILRLKERKPTLEETTDPSVMRLKGGGKKFWKRKNCRKAKVQKCPKKKREKEEEEEEGSMVTRNDAFVTKKPYDMTEYQDLAQERVIGMKNLMLTFLSDCKTRRTAREKALKAVFCSFTAARAEAGGYNSAHGRYFFATGRSKTAVYDANRLLQMKKIVEDRAREKGWLSEKDINWDEMNELLAKLCDLDNKLCLLLRKQKLE